MSLQEQLALALANAKSAYEAGDIDKGDGFKVEAEKLSKAVKNLEALTGIEADAAKSMRPTLPTNSAGSQSAQNQQPAVGDATMKAVYTMRFGEDGAAKTAVLSDLIGNDYRQRIWDQNAAFAKYLRGGENAIDRDEYKMLKSQIFAFEDITGMIQNGFSVASIKATMVEAQGTLGGFAVPATMQSEILRRLPGLTAVRGAGATVVNLTTGNTTEFLEVTGGNDRYTSGLRGAWGSETQNPTEKNLALGSKSVNADVYTYKVPFSQSLVEDAANLVNILQEEAMTTMAIDEDEAFLIGDGVGKPLGLLPGSANGLSLTEVVSGSGSAVTSDGLFSLRRGIAAQYRQGAVWIAASATFGAIEKLKDSQNRYLFDIQKADVSVGDDQVLLRRRVYESEAMPAIAANAYPIVFGNMRGYGIVERSGMTVARFQDSNTGINKVEYHFRRRVGGRPMRPWLFAVQKIST